MTLFVSWTDEATEDLLGILDYIAARNVSASERINALIHDTAERLSDHPYIHRPGRVSGTREAIVHPNYILVYRIGDAMIEVVAVLHARQQYP